MVSYKYLPILKIEVSYTIFSKKTSEYEIKYLVLNILQIKENALKYLNNKSINKTLV